MLSIKSKHIKGHNNFIETKGEITYPNVESLVNRFAGKGQPIPNNIGYGLPGYRERFDAGEVIGTFIKRNTDGTFTAPVPTTRGIIRYAKDGVHITPSAPNN